MRFIVFNVQGRTNVGHDHTFFNQLMGIVTLNGHDVFNLALGIENKFTFLRFKLNGTTLSTGFFKRAVQVV